MAKRMQKIHTKLQPTQDTDPNSNIEKSKTSARFASKLKGDRTSQSVTSGPIKCKVAGRTRSRTDSKSDPVDFQFRGKTCSRWALRTPRRRSRLSKVRENLQPFGSVTFFGIRNRSNLAKKIMIFFWPNFDVRKEQISIAKRGMAKRMQKIHRKLQP